MGFIFRSLLHFFEGSSKCSSKCSK